MASKKNPAPAPARGIARPVAKAKAPEKPAKRTATKPLPAHMQATKDQVLDTHNAQAEMPMADYVPQAEICERMAAFQLEIEYRPVTEKRNAVQEALQQSYKDVTHNALVTLVVEDMNAYTPPSPNSGEGGGYPICAADHPIGADTKFFVKRAIERFVIATDYTVEVVRVVVQQTPLTGIRFII